MVSILCPRYRSTLPQCARRERGAPPGPAPSRALAALPASLTGAVPRRLAQGQEERGNAQSSSTQVSPSMMVLPAATRSPHSSKWCLNSLHTLVLPHAAGGGGVGASQLTRRRGRGASRERRGDEREREGGKARRTLPDLVTLLWTATGAQVSVTVLKEPLRGRTLQQERERGRTSGTSSSSSSSAPSASSCLSWSSWTLAFASSGLSIVSVEVAERSSSCARLWGIVSSAARVPKTDSTTDESENMAARGWLWVSALVWVRYRPSRLAHLKVEGGEGGRRGRRSPIADRLSPSSPPSRPAPALLAAAQLSSSALALALGSAPPASHPPLAAPCAPRPALLRASDRLAAPPHTAQPARRALLFCACALPSRSAACCSARRAGHARTLARQLRGPPRRPVHALDGARLRLRNLLDVRL